MATITYRTTEQTAARLKNMAVSRGVSVNKLLDEMAIYAIASYDTESRFRARAARGSAARGLAFLDELDAHYAGEAGQQQEDVSSSGYTLHDGAEDAYTHGVPPSSKDKD